MRKWLYSLLYLVIILLTITLLLPFLMGVISKNRCDQIAKEINEKSPASIKILSYKRNWFHSNATANVDFIKSDTSDKKSPSFNITAKIKHGPLLINWIRFNFAQAIIDADVRFNSAQNENFKPQINSESIANIRIKFRLNGDTRITVDSQPSTYHDKEKSLNWHGLKIKSNISSLHNKTQTKIDFSGIDIESKKYSLYLGAATGFYQGNKIDNGIWTGERNLQFSSFSIKNENDRVTSFKDLNLQIITTKTKDRSVDFTTKLSADSLSINGAIYDKNNLDFTAYDLNPITLSKIQRQLITNQDIFALNTTTTLSTLIEIINNTGKIEIKNLSSNTPWGKLITDINMIFNLTPNPTGLISTVFNSQIEANFKAQNHLALHLIEKFYEIIPNKEKQIKDPSKKAQETLEEWLNSGKLSTSEKDNYLHTNINYKNGQLLINDRELTFGIKS